VYVSAGIEEMFNYHENRGYHKSSPTTESFFTSLSTETWHYQILPYPEDREHQLQPCAIMRCNTLLLYCSKLTRVETHKKYCGFLFPEKIFAFENFLHIEIYSNLNSKMMLMFLQLHDAHVKAIKRKAGAENAKISEVAFINQMM
jgi:hypothetical protein